MFMWSFGALGGFPVTLYCSSLRDDTLLPSRAERNLGCIPLQLSLQNLQYLETPMQFLSG